MKKYLSTQTGNELKIGDTIFLKTILAGYQFHYVIKFTEETIPYLLSAQLIKEIPDKESRCESSCDIPYNIDYLINHLAKRIHWKPDNVYKYLSVLDGIDSMAVYKILLREVAIILDSKYPDNIKESKEIWYISDVDMEIHQVKELGRIKSFVTFAAFRTLQDAIIAKNTLKDVLDMKSMYKNGGK